MEVEDQLYSSMCRVINKRKTYPTLILKKAEEHVTKELRALANVKVDINNEDERKMIKMANECVIKMSMQIPTCVILSEVSERYRQHNKNMDEIEDFLKLLDSFKN